MAETMDKKNVLYRTAFKVAANINWSTITKLNHGKAAPAKVKIDVGKLLDEPKNNKMELKVGVVGKKGKYKLLLRVKNGSKHIYDGVLSDKYEYMSELDKANYTNAQIKGVAAATKELDGYFKQTAQALKDYKSIKTKFDKYKTDYANHKKVLADPSTTPKDFSIHLGKVKVIQNILNRFPDMVAEVYKRHQGEISDLRSGGGGRLCSKNGVDDERGADIKKRFMDHTKAYKEFESTVLSFAPKCKELKATVTEDIKLFDKKQGVAKTLVIKLEKSLATMEEAIEHASRNMKPSEMEMYLKADALHVDMVTLDARIKTAEGRMEGLDKVYHRIEKLMNSRLADVKGDMAKRGDVKHYVEKLKSTLAEFKKKIEAFRILANKALVHTKKVIQDLNAATAK